MKIDITDVNDLPSSEPKSLIDIITDQQNIINHLRYDIGILLFKIEQLKIKLSEYQVII